MTSTTAATLRWLDALWPFVRASLPSTPGRVVEIGCGESGGFVPAMLRQGHDAIGVDPAAPSKPGYHPIEFEHYAPSDSIDAIVACTSLHHVRDVHDLLEHAREMLAPDGTIVVVEWAYEAFDEATARWCFDRLLDSSDPGWLHHHQQQWLASGQPWPAYRDAWAVREHIHTGDAILEALQVRFTTRLLAHGPYFFPDLHPTGETEEQAAIRAGQIQATGIRYVGHRPP